MGSISLATRRKQMQFLNTSLCSARISNFWMSRCASKLFWISKRVKKRMKHPSSRVFAADRLFWPARVEARYLDNRASKERLWRRKWGRSKIFCSFAVISRSVGLKTNAHHRVIATYQWQSVRANTSPASSSPWLLIRSLELRFSRRCTVCKM